MHRLPLLTMLARHQPFDGRESDSLARIAVFVRANADCFERSNRAGHITGSAWLLNGSRRRVLLTHHRKLNKWLQLGGHADGEADVLRAALREAIEESGIGETEGALIEPLSTAIFDVDVHRIPARGDEPEHFHYDIRFLLGVRPGVDPPIRASDESHDLKWVTKKELPRLDVDESVLRMHCKWLAM
jgi:8-oxo-dGTP pyrophosphatase MutT (NUDIX family)